MKVSVIIPIRNGARYLGGLFKTFREQTFMPAQILVIDSSSDIETLKMCEASGVDHIPIDTHAFDHGGTRNLAATIAKGEILVFLTQDALFKDNRSLENLISPLGDKTIAASYGRQMPKEDANPVEKFVRSFNYPSMGMVKGIEDLPRLGIKTFFFSNAFSAIKKEVYQEAGGFPEKTIMDEDMFLAAKLIQKGYKIAYQADALVYHSHNYPLTTQFKRYFDIGVFFSRNQWIRDLAKPEREGMRYLKEEIQFLSANGQRGWIPHALADTIVRFFGYRAGLLERKFPLSLKKRASHNKGFWEEQHPH